MMKKLIANLLVVVAGISIAMAGAADKSAGNGKTEEELKLLTRQMIAASADERDPDVFEKVFADDCSMVTASGGLLNKVEMMNIVRKSNFRHYKANIHDMKVTIWDNLAIVNDHSSVAGRRGTTEFNEEFWGSRVFAKRNGEWKIVASQVTRVTGK